MRRAVAVLVVLASCSTFASFDPKPLDQVPFLERAETATRDGLTVTVAVLSEAETRAVFGLPLYGENVQPVWIEVRNDSDDAHVLVPAAMDPDYFSPFEVAWQSHFLWRGDTNRKMDELIFARAFRHHVPARSTRRGFVYTNLDLGAKFVNVELVSEGDVKRFQFALAVPGLETKPLDPDEVYAAGEIVDHTDLAALREALEKLPRATLDKKGESEGDPLNIVVIGNDHAVYSAFIRRNWHMTETITGTTAIKTGWSFLFGSSYKYSPMSSLYLFGRAQDIGLQKARQTIHQRNHLRLWVAPMTWKGQRVWIGQISRDIGVTTSRRTLITHKIDPDVDETRFALLQDFYLSRSLAMFGYCLGVGHSFFFAPRVNLGNDPYFTDGRRLVMFVADGDVPYDRVKRLDWEEPDRR